MLPCLCHLRRTLGLCRYGGAVSPNQAASHATRLNGRTCARPPPDLENVVTDDRAPVMLGVVGLQNLGNTCFMNSTLQCLSNTPPLRQYFSSRSFVSDVNRANPLGHEGKLAESFGELMGLMWPERAPKVGRIGSVAWQRRIGDHRQLLSIDLGGCAWALKILLGP